MPSTQPKPGSKTAVFKRRSISDLLAMIAGIITAIAGFSGAIISSRIDLTKSDDRLAHISNLLDETYKRTLDLHKELDSVKEQIKNLSNVSEQSQVAAQLAETDKVLKDLATRHSKIEEVIMNNRQGLLRCRYSEKT